MDHCNLIRFIKAENIGGIAVVSKWADGECMGRQYPMSRLKFLQMLFSIRLDVFTKAPYINNLGRMWGSTRFMSPEEFERGTTIDEITNVYLMGATAFALFSDYSRTIEDWHLNRDLYKVAIKAVNNERSQRQQSIQQFIDEWNEARILE